jgi:hypothetical protein
VPGGIAYAAADSAQTAIVTAPRAGRFAIILDAVTRHYGVSRDEILSDDRSRRVVRPRQVAIYLAFHLTGKDIGEIGRRIGGREPTTVLHACRKMEGLKKSDPAAATDINRLMAQCIRAMRANGIPLDAKSYAQARWSLKVKTPHLASFRSVRYGRAFVLREAPWLADFAV